jgi:hypothetical protein
MSGKRSRKRNQALHFRRGRRRRENNSARAGANVRGPAGARDRALTLTPRPSVDRVPRL